MTSTNEENENEQENEHEDEEQEEVEREEPHTTALFALARSRRRSLRGYGPRNSRRRKGWTQRNPTISRELLVSSDAQCVEKVGLARDLFLNLSTLLSPYLEPRSASGTGRKSSTNGSDRFIIMVLRLHNAPSISLGGTLFDISKTLFSTRFTESILGLGQVCDEINSK
jgi:hypothetical protein